MTQNQLKTRWPQMSVQDRWRHIQPAYDFLRKHSASWALAIASDVQKPYADALAGDVWTTLETFAFIKKNVQNILVENRSKPFLFFNSQFYERHLPLGDVLIIGPWNYPLQLSLIPVLCALIAGNVVTLKPSEWAPKNNALLREAFQETGLLNHVLHIVEGDGKIGEQTLKSKKWDLVLFTGSTSIGGTVQKYCYENHIPAILELGGQDIAVIYESAHLERAATGLAFGSLLNTGQVCSGARHLLVHKNIYTAFLAKFNKSVTSFVAGPSYGKTFRHSDTITVNRLANQLIDRGASVFEMNHSDITNGEKTAAQIVFVPVNDQHGFHFWEKSTQEILYKQEFFGPLVFIRPYENDEQLLTAVENNPYGLSLSLWGGPQQKTQMEFLAHRARVGQVYFNSIVDIMANAHCSFGGQKLSGEGRYRGAAGIHQFCRRQSIQRNSGFFKTDLVWQPLTTLMQKLFLHWIKIIYR